MVRIQPGVPHTKKETKCHIMIEAHITKLESQLLTPLIQIERKLKKVQEVLDNINEESILTATDLKIKLQKALDDD